jgi:hypothetical protein
MSNACPNGCRPLPSRKSERFRATAKPGCVSERAVDENNGGISHL